MSQANGWGRDVFALALAIQILIWGAVQPVAGAIADRFGPVRVLCATGVILYSVGLALMVYSTTPLTLVFRGRPHGLRHFGELLHARDRRVRQAAATGVAFARVRRGDCCGVVRSVSVFAARRWTDPRLRLAERAPPRSRVIVLLIIPLALVLAAPSFESTTQTAAPAQKQSLRDALSEAFGHRSYVLLVLGFFTCGFQLLFITVHLPAYRRRPRPVRRCGGMDDRRNRPVQHYRLAARGVARRSHAEALSACGDLSVPIGRGARLHHVPGDAERRPSHSAR